MQVNKWLKVLHINIILYILLSTLLFAEKNAENDHSDLEDEAYIVPSQICYQFKQEDFKHTSKIADDLIIDITSKEYIGFKTSSSRKTFSDSYAKYFECIESQPDHYECSRWNSIEKMHYYLQDEAMYLNVDYLQVPLEDDTIVHHIKSKNKNFTKGSLTPCYLSMDPVIAVENIKKETPKDLLLRSIKINDVIIYDLDYYKDLVIAVGEDNSPRTRELQSQDEHHESTILRSKNGGKTWEKVGQGSSMPHDHVIVLDDKRIIIASSIEGSGGEILISSDGGNSWKTTYSRGMIETLQRNNGEIILTEITGSVFKSKDSGESWTETVPMQDEQVEEVQETPTQQKSDTKSQFHFLSKPEYRIDYQTNTLIVQQSKNNCDTLSLSLLYNQSNQREGILGPFWSLGSIESQITPLNKDELLFFDSYRGKEKHYTRDKNNHKFFYYNGSSKIEETIDGYVIKCDRSSHHFNKNGYLKKIKYKNQTYTLHYQNNRLHQIIENTKETKHPYLSFSYPYEGVSITFYPKKKKQTITFVKNSEKLLSSILEDNKHLYHYTYAEDSKGENRLFKIEDMTKTAINRTLLRFQFDYFNNDSLTVDDFTSETDGYITEKKYYHYNKNNEHTCIVNTLTKYIRNDQLTDVNVDLDMYYFEYFDQNQKRLVLTRHGKETYGFDEVGRINFYGDEDGNVSVNYSQFNKIENSLVYRNNQPFQYTYLYTDDTNHYLKKVISLQEEIDLSYDQQGLITELKTKKHHLKLEYDKHKKTKRIIIPKKGEIITNHDSQSGELINIDTLTYDKNIKGLMLTNELTHAMQTLRDKVSEGGIKNYPSWLW